MHQSQSLKRQPGAAGRQAFRPSRQTLHTQCLHKALRKPNAGPITAPADVVYECLTLFRRPDLESLVPFFPPTSFDPNVRRVGLVVGGEVVEEAGPLACCHGFMDTAARRVLPGHLLRRCRVLSSVQLPGGICQLRVALTARTGEEAVFVWRLRRLTPSEGPGAAVAAATTSTATTATTTAAAAADHRPGLAAAAAATAAAGGRAGEGAPPGVTHADDDDDAAPSSSPQPPEPLLRGLSADATSPTLPKGHPGAATSALHGREGGDAGAAAATAVGEHQVLVSEQATTSRVDSEQPVTAWVVERVSRDDSHDEEEMPVPGPTGRGPHPRCSPEQVVKAQLAALRRGDVAGAASFNLWSRSTSGGWDLHMSAFRALLRQPSYHVLLTCGGAELGPSALPSGRKMVQEVRLLAGGGAGAEPAPGPGPRAMVFQLCMQANGCWLVEAIRAIRD